MMNFWQNLGICIGRVLMSSLFLWAGLAKIFHWRGTIEYMQSKGFPLIRLLLPAAILMQLIGGLSLILGYHTRIGALILIVFIIPAAIKMHNFWGLSGAERSIEKTLFMKDAAILGGLLLILIFGAGHFSFDSMKGY